MTIPSEILEDTVRAYNVRGQNQSTTAEALGIARSTLQNRLTQATARGIGPHFVADEIPTGLEVKGTSTLYGASGEVRGQWVKTRGVPLHIAVEIIRDTLGEPAHAQEKLEKFLHTPADCATIYPIADLHFGMYSWEEEVGYDYDTEIAQRTLTNAFTELLGRGPSTDVGIVLNLGDFFHSDNDEQRTRRSGNKLDVDTRYARVLREGVSLLRRITDMAATKHKSVVIKNIPGNHDPYGSLALTTGLAMHYDNCHNVLVDTRADPIWVYPLGQTLLCAAHGDGVKAKDLPALVAAEYSGPWGNALWRYGYVGHQHERRVWENAGMEVEMFRTVAPRDAWGHWSGHHAGRSLLAITHDHHRGEVERHTVNIK